MDIKEIFLQLTENTTPEGNETDLEQYLPSSYKNDPYGNYYIEIGNSTTMFTSHLDNKCEEVEEVNIVFKGNNIKTDGFTILGADDNFEWDKGFGPRFGLVHVDYRDQKRTVRESARKLAEVSRSGEI